MFRVNLKTILKTIFYFYAIFSQQASGINEQKPESLISTFCEQKEEGKFVCGYGEQTLPIKYEKCQGFSIIAGNPDQATRFILGEKHQLRSSTAQCIDKLTKNVIKHDILIEGSPFGEPFNCSIDGISPRKGRTCRGWDMENYFEDLEIDYPAYSLLIHLRTEIIVGKLSDEDSRKFIEKHLLKNKEIEVFIKFLEKKYDLVTIENIIIEKLPLWKQIIKLSAGNGKENFDQTLKKIYDNIHMHQEICKDLLLTKQKERKSFLQIVEEKAKEEMINNAGLFDYLTKNNLLKRNKKLMKALEEVHPEIAIAVVGASHLIKTGAKTIDDSGAVDYLRRELEKGSDQNPYAILVMDEFVDLQNRKPLI